MRFLKLAAALLLAQALLTSGMRPTSRGQSTAVAGSNSAPKAAALPGFDVADMDKAADPCADFYQYACGTWMVKNPIPPDQSIWGQFNKLEESNRLILRQILEQHSADQPTRSAVEQKIGDYYASCMDEQAIDRKGLAPLEPELVRIDALPNNAALVEELIHLHSDGVSALFEFGSEQDFKNSTQVIARADQGGLGLPDRDYYLKTDPKSVELRNQYLAHVRKMFELSGHPPRQAAAAAEAVMTIETALARGSLDRVARRDPQKIYHKLTKQQLMALSPSFSWPKYFEGVGAPTFDSLNVAVPEFFKQMNALLDTAPPEQWKTYLKWHLLHSLALLLPTPFVNENFKFYGKTLTGAKELRPRWKRCVDLTDDQLGEALGQKYVERAFSPEAKQRTLEMVREIEDALGRDLTELSWMTPATKQQAMIKLRAITNKIGYPDKWRDYGTVGIVRGDALGNSQRASTFEFRRQLNKIGRPVDRQEWQMTPPTVNAYYDPQMNNINFPAGILQPPFYDVRMDPPVNFGGIGAVIGHELTHGFDDEGRQFDAEGNLRDWWTAQDAREFEQRASCIAEEYAGFVAVDDVHLNGRLTLGENVADNGGLRISHMALLRVLSGKQAAKIDGFTPAQRFFLGWGQVWCQNRTEQVARMRAMIDPHSPGKYRVNGVIMNMPEFRKAFGCTEGQPMAPSKICRVW